MPCKNHGIRFVAIITNRCELSINQIYTIVSHSYQMNEFPSFFCVVQIVFSVDFFFADTNHLHYCLSTTAMLLLHTCISLFD